MRVAGNGRSNLCDNVQRNGFILYQKVMNKVTISVEHKIATNNKSEEVKKNEMAVLNRFEVRR